MKRWKERSLDEKVERLRLLGLWTDVNLLILAVAVLVWVVVNA